VGTRSDVLDGGPYTLLVRGKFWRNAWRQQCKNGKWIELPFRWWVGWYPGAMY